MMMRTWIFLWMYCLLATAVWGQGKLLLIGGGGEDDGSWSDAPYRWAVEQSANKRVAIVSFEEETDWLPGYFLRLGAVQARNFRLDTEEAANEAYDSLLAHDVVFFKGGDQANYYFTYRNTRTAQAVQEIYARGGVVAGTSAGMMALSGVVFTAENGSIYPDEAVLSLESPYYTLAADFLGLLPGYVFDSHFVERGRLPRLLGFMAQWHQATGERIGGIGVDDRTALAIANGQGQVFGTATATICLPAQGLFDGGALWQLQAQPLLVLAQGNTIDFATGETSGYLLNMPEPLPVRGLQPLLLGGGHSAASAQGLLEHLVRQVGAPADPICLLSKAPEGLAAELRERLLQLGAGGVTVVQALPGNALPEPEALFQAHRKFVVAGNDWADFDAFLDAPAGQALRRHWQRPDGAIAFVGANADFAGAWQVPNLRNDDLAAYYGELELRPGLGLIEGAAVVGAAFGTGDAYRDFYENSMSALPWVMANRGVSAGLWVGGDGFVVATARDGHYAVEAMGPMPLVLLQRGAGKYRIASSGRQTWGTQGLTVGVLRPGMAHLLGTAGPTAVEGENAVATAKAYPVPAREWLRLELPPQWGAVSYQATDMAGRKIAQGQLRHPEAQLPVHDWPAGLYVLHLYPASGPPVALRISVAR
jgi:cyanophycinase-like exopeptidase